MGFPEGVEGGDGVRFLQEWLPKILKINMCFEIERSHRTLLQPRPAEHDRPQGWLFACCVAVIRRKSSRAKKVGVQNSTIMIFRDVSTALYKRRKAFTDLKKLLRRCDVKYSLLYPATLWIDLPGGRRSFTCPKSAETYLRQYHPEYFWGRIN